MCIEAASLFVRAPTSGRGVVVVRVCLRFVLATFLFLGAIFVAMHDPRVIVFVLVI